MSDEVIEGCQFHKTHDMHCANCTSTMRPQAEHHREVHCIECPSTKFCRPIAWECQECHDQYFDLTLSKEFEDQATRIKALEKLIERAQETTEKWLGFASKAKKERDAALAEVAGLREALEHVAKYAGHLTRCQPNLNCRGGCDIARFAEQMLEDALRKREG